MKRIILLSALFGMSSRCLNAQTYQVYYKKGYRYDNAQSWIIIGKDDINDVKKTINDVYHKLGTKQFSLLIVNDNTAAVYAKMESDMLHLNRTQSLYLDKHTVATYDGELETFTHKHELDYKDFVTEYEPK